MTEKKTHDINLEKERNVLFESQKQNKKHLVLLRSHPPKLVTELLERTSDELGLLPEIGSQESIGVTNSGKGSLEGVFEGLGGSRRGSVDIRDTS